MKRLSSLLTATFLATLFTISPFAQDLKFSIHFPLTGPQAKFGEIEKRSNEIVTEEINAAGGIKGRLVVLEFEDSNGKPEISKSIVEKLINVTGAADVMVSPGFALS